MNYFLFDNPNDRKYMDFINLYSNLNYKLVFPQKRCRSLMEMYSICWKQILKSKKNDTIVCWYDFMGIICWWICFFLRKRRNIVAVNILLKNKETKKNKIVKFLYKIPLKKGLKASVTSSNYGEWLNAILGIDRKYPIIHDVYHNEYECDYTGKIEENSVFCGGRNGRDWGLVFELSNRMPDFKFNLIMTTEEYESYKNRMGNNIFVQTNTSQEDFLKELCKSTLVILPLNTQAPAGLIVLFQAGANHKAVITTRTVTTEEYVGNARGILCENNLEEWEKKIRLCMESEKQRKEISQNLYNFLTSECNEKNFITEIDKLVIS